MSNWKVTRRNKYTCGLYSSLQAVKVRGPEDATLATYELRRETTSYDETAAGASKYNLGNFEKSRMIIRPKSEGTPDTMNAWGDSSRQFNARKASPGKRSQARETNNR